MSNLAPKFTPQSFRAARKILDAKRTSAMTLCYATTLIRTYAGEYAIVHHNTSIVTFHADNSITLNGSGWASRTTADRMHRFTPPNVRVNSRKNRLGVELNGTDIGDATFGLTIHP